MESRHITNLDHLEPFKITESQFEQRRDSLLNYKTYAETFDKVLESTRNYAKELEKIPDTPEEPEEESNDPDELDDIYDGEESDNDPGLWADVVQIHVGEILNLLCIQYAAGAPAEFFVRTWPTLMEWVEERGRWNEESQDWGSVLDMEGSDYWLIALRLVCFGLLSGNAEFMPRVMACIDYGNERPYEKDGLIERLVAPFVPGRASPPDRTTRILPYRKLLPVFDAAPEQRAALMARYLEEWYSASRREPYRGWHNSLFIDYTGHWSWEAAAVTWLLEIDDTSYRDMPHYPSDLVDFARHVPQTPAPPAPPVSETALPEPEDEDESPEESWSEQNLDVLQTRVLQLLRLINPGDECAAREQFEEWCCEYEEDIYEYREESDEENDRDTGYRIWQIYLASVINGYSGFSVDWKNTSKFMAIINNLAWRWNLIIDWSGNRSDDEVFEFFDLGIPDLMVIAHDQLRAHGYLLWNLNTHDDSYSGWITRSHDEERIRALARLLGIEMSPGNRPF